MIELELQIATDFKTLPHPAQFREWVRVVFEHKIDNAELTIRLVDEAESAELNEKYRHKKGPTNVLSFPGVNMPKISSELFSEILLGDIVICAPVIAKEAEAQNKELIAHFAHMVIHGTLHLLGYDHQTTSDAKIMESLEIDLLQKLGFSSPYDDEHADNSSGDNSSVHKNREHKNNPHNKRINNDRIDS